MAGAPVLASLRQIRDLIRKRVFSGAAKLVSRHEHGQVLVFDAGPLPALDGDALAEFAPASAA